MAGRFTMQDIANEAGLSLTAVSLVLNDQPCRLSPENKQLIRDIARKHNYKTNQIARSLATSRTHTLGLVVPDIENQFFSSLSKRLEVLSRQAGYALFIANSNDSPSEDRSLMEMMAAREVDGLFLIVSTTFDEEDEKLRQAISELSVPLVLVDRDLDGVDRDLVQFDNELGARIAVRHLLERGHTRIGCVANTLSSGNGRARLRGYQQALAEKGIEPRPEWVVESDYYMPGGYAAGAALARTNVTAVFSCSDMVSLGLLKRFHELGVDVPRDCSIVSYDNSAALFLANPGLTAVEQNVSQLAEQAFDLLGRRIDGWDGPMERRVLEPRLVVKDSVADLRA